MVIYPRADFYFSGYERILMIYCRILGQLRGKFQKLSKIKLRAHQDEDKAINKAVTRTVVLLPISTANLAPIYRTKWRHILAFRLLLTLI